MKTLGFTRFGAIALLFCVQLTSASAVTFSHDAFISFADLSYEGEDIVVTNCTLTVDGAHSFNSLQVLNGGVVTHSPFIYGPQQFSGSVFDEPQTLSATNPATLGHTNVDSSSIVVMNTSGTFIYAENVDYIVTISNQFTQLLLTTNSSIAEGSIVYVNYNWSQEFQGFNLSISGNVTVAPGGAINVSGMGYAGAIGVANGTGTSRGTNYPYTFTAGGGAAHGGYGGMSSTFAGGGTAYDSASAPGFMGSGGASGSAEGGSGGGIALLTVGGNVQIDGLVAADGFNGTNTHSGGGSGGSVLITAQGGFSGAGTITANGGSGDLPDGGGAGGGRIAVYFASNNFAGSITAFGGNGAMAGGAGTIYLKQNNPFIPADLWIVNGGKRGTNTSFAVVTIGNLLISGGAVAQPSSGLYLSSLNILSNSWLTAVGPVPLNINVSNNATIGSGAMINADSRIISGSGAGSAACGYGSGGSYGGYGGASACGTPGGHVIYGSIIQPTSSGSPGVGTGLGGGAIQLTVTGTLSLDGSISANGGPATTIASGGGSGGSVWVTAGVLQGGGSITANGGSARNLVSGGGSGGRVAVYFHTNLFTGAMTAHGGTGANDGGPGTVFFQNNSPLNFINELDLAGHLIVDNGGLPGTSMLPAPFGSTSSPLQWDLSISGGAVLTNFDTQIVSTRNLFIGSNSWFASLPQSPQGGLSITASNAVIQAGGGIIEDGDGTLTTAGMGLSDFATGGGGGNAGFGGNSATNAAGGVAQSGVGLTTSAHPGGVGGAGTGPGGFGGGVLNFTASNLLQLDGYLSANGLPGSGLNSGGGAGGSVTVSAHVLSGAGSITANGGAGNNAGGGGGGGFIQLYLDTNSFQGTVAAQGGGGANYGGAGIVVSGLNHIANQIPIKQMVVDNGGHRGAPTPLLIQGLILNAFVTGGAITTNFNPGAQPQFGNMTVGSNSTMLISSYLEATFSVTNTLTVMAGGSINSDGLSASTAPLPGQAVTSTGGGTVTSTGGGGAGAGYGGNSFSNAPGGLPSNDNPIQPLTTGGRGGYGLFEGPGGNGGGSVRFTVGHLLQLDGRISADGLAGPTANSGGGGGGVVSISMPSGAISGAGTISVNGGAGNGLGGGGGGGHIAITYGSNSFAGTLTAHGGIGGNVGGAGIIYTTRSPGFNLSPQQYIIDNGGLIGAITPFSGTLSDNANLNITGGAVVSNTATLGSGQLGFLLVGSNSTWIVGGAATARQASFTINSNATIQASGRITMDGSVSQGVDPGFPVGISGNIGGGGAGHGGYGGSSISNAPGGNASSDPEAGPTGTGSQGGYFGGLGGGALRLMVNRSLQLDGKISADGLAGVTTGSGGGSGGSVWVSANSFSGTGFVSANGGAGNSGGGGGGGGRVGIWYNTNQFAGSVTARGGAGGHIGGAGTIYFASSISGAGRTNQLIVDNGGAPGTNTPITNPNAAADLIISNGATATVSGVGASPWNSLTIAPGSSLSLASNTLSTTITVNSNLTVQPGGSINLDGVGSVANSGNGRGSSLTASGSGGGHGGYGGPSISPNSPGGASYDLINQPNQAGSGGGLLGGTGPGSAGGAALHLIVNGTLTDNGIISANGQDGVVSGAGGGAGGSFWISAGALVGSGKISANGGNGEPFGGGGGGAGGRIAIYTRNFPSVQFTGTISAHGGTGPTLAGGAGTIYLSITNFNPAVPPSATINLVLDNNGLPGTNTPLTTFSPVPMLSIANGAAASASAPITVQSLSVNAGGVFNPLLNVLQPLNLTVLGNALVDTGGAINANAFGFSSETGPYSGSVDYFGDGSGGGYGGAGGASLFGAPGGITYGSSNAPINLGSQGGMSPELPGFSQGGGAIRLTVNGTLTVNGAISANGNDGFIAGSGGGSGGSIWITSGGLNGNGAIIANGGMGESDEGGGGGGGRIAIYTGTNTFAGSVLAAGGDGAMPGQDGTVYVPASFSISGVVSNSDGTAAPGVMLQPSNLASVTSDANGAYTITVSPIWKGSVSPIAGGVIIPSSRTYSGLLADQTGQDYLITTQAAFNLTGGQTDGTNVMLNFYGISGVKYQPLCSSNLVDWTPCGAPYVGNNGPMTFTYPCTNAPQMYFRLQVTY